MAGGGGVRGRREGHCSGRYASYWNAFLFNILLIDFMKLNYRKGFSCVLLIQCIAIA